MKDKILGELIYDHGFEKIEELQFFSKKYNIRVALQSYDETITNEQRDAYIEFKENYDTVIEKLPNILLEYYLKIYDSFISEIVDLPEKIDKEHINEETVVKLVIPKTLYITKKGKYGLLCNCYWDQEHGIAILFEHNSLSIIEQDELI